MTDATSSKDEKDQNTDGKISFFVANHYNNLDERGVNARKESRIYYMRNFNNWIKSVIIGDTLEQIRKRRGNECKINVLDIGCGKGGDLLKYKIGRISHIVCADIAEISLNQCKERYELMVKREQNNNQKNRRFNRFKNDETQLFTAEFIAADCTRVRLKDKYENTDIKFDCVSIQFSFHYCFESLTQAECMIRNASEALRLGGYFIGTTPDSYEIIRRLRESESNSFGNDIYSVTFDSAFSDSEIPLFGTKYDFHLEGVVNCPEFLVYFHVFVVICEKYGLKLVFRKRFDDYYVQNKDAYENRQLLERMNVLEAYPPSGDVKLMGNDDDYEHAKRFMEKFSKNGENEKVGTLSAAEWDVISLYVLFVFEKVKDTETESSNKRRKN